jgi:hypothetical protein
MVVISLPAAVVAMMVVSVMRLSSINLLQGITDNFLLHTSHLIPVCGFCLVTRSLMRSFWLHLIAFFQKKSVENPSFFGLR